MMGAARRTAQCHQGQSDRPHRPAQDTGKHIDFGAPAVLRKWPSIKNERAKSSANPYLVIDGTLDECIRGFLAKPASQRHLYEIHTAPQAHLIPAVLSAEHITEIARLRDFL
jgi:hypothetical protein